jgi:hypothetical protein
MRIDWQAFEDGTLNPAEQEQAELQLKSDPQARQQLEGLREFRRAIKEAARSETAPNLERLMPTPQGARRPVFKWAYAPAIAAVILLLLFGWRAVVYDPLRLDLTPTAQVIAIDAPTEAASWVSSHAGFSAPPITLEPEAELVGARFGEGWACYDYSVDGQPVYLYMSPVERAPPRTLDVQMNDRRFAVGKGIGWNGERLAYYIRGGDPEIRRRLALLASSQTDSAF